MGTPVKKLYCTNPNIDDGSVLLASWIPDRHEDGLYYWPKDTPLGSDMWIPNILNLESDESVEVELAKSEEETGIWIICYDGYFPEEDWIYNFKPKFIEGTHKFDYNDASDLGIMVNAPFKIKEGEIFPVTLRRK